MRRHAISLHEWRVGAATGLVLLASVIQPAHAGAATAAEPDLTAMTLTADDLPAGARLREQHHDRVAGTDGAYHRAFAFSQRAARRSGLRQVVDDTLLLRHANDAYISYYATRLGFAEKQARHGLARTFARHFGVSTDRVTVGRPRSEHLAAGAFSIRIVAHLRRRSVTSAVGVITLGRALAQLDVLGAPGRHGVMRTVHRLLTAMHDRIRAALLPQSTAAPTIFGDATVGNVLQATTGSWGDATRPTSFSYQWQRCGVAGCADIPGARDASYQVTADDQGSELRVLVTAGNDVGKVTVGSPFTPPVT